MPIPNLTWDALKTELSGVVLEILEELADDATLDLKTFATEIATDMVLALQDGDSAMRDELKNQVRALGEAYRIKFVQAQWAAFDKVVSVAMRVGASLITHA